MIWNEFPCLDFVDSEFADHTGSGLRFDRLALVEWQKAFLAHWKWQAPVPASTAQLADLRKLRVRLRRLLERASAGQGLDRSDLSYLNRELASARFVFKVDHRNGLGMAPLRKDWQWVIAELIRSAVDIVTKLDARRLRVCANPDCSWLFYDESMNRSRRWCQVNYCGNLVKVREFRARKRAGSVTA